MGQKVKRAEKERLEERRDTVRRYLRQGLAPRQILHVMADHYRSYKNPYGTLWKDIQAVREEDERALKLVTPDAAMAEYIGRLEELFGRAVRDSLQLQGTARVGALNAARDLAKDIARAKGVDRRMLGEGRDVTIRPGEGEDGLGSWESLVLEMRRSRGLDDGAET